MANKNIPISPSQLITLKDGFFLVWNEIGHDVGEVEDNEEAIELCLDASRLERKHPEAAKLVDDLVKEHGYGPVLKHLARFAQVL